VHCKEISARMREITEVLELHSVAGEYDLLAKIRTTHARALEDILYKVKAIPGVVRTTTTVVLNTEYEI
jgi:Lrp/AsnC family transcriptional regulator, leucine-responsive regulatory protein